MGPKKKNPNEEEDFSTRDLQNIYRKNCKEFEIPLCKIFDSRLVEVLSEDAHLPEILINEKIGEFGARSLSNALIKTNKQKGYKHLQSIRIWDGDFGDEGTRAFQQYITDTFNSSVTIIEFLNCGISPLGCEFISRMFDLQIPSKITILTLDYNQFSNEGVANLMSNIEKNKTLTYLSMAYCGIEDFGVRFMKRYLESNECVLKKLILQGNPLKNPGVNELINMLLNNPSLEELNINNVQFGTDIDTANNLARLMETTNSLLCYYLKFNFITEEDIDKMMIALKENSNIWYFEIDENIPKEKFEEYLKLLKSRKDPRLAKKGGKKAAKK